MIPLDYITEWRVQVPWPMPSQVEQDLILSRAIIALFAHPEVARHFAFRGGTALYKLFISPAARYSEDIDLVQTAAGAIGPVLTAIRTVLDPWLGLPKRTATDGRITMLYRLTSEGQPPVPLRLKIEINSREHFSILGIQERPFEVRSRWFTGKAAVRTYRLDELLGTKLRALFQRKKGRDLFDLYIAGRGAEVDPERVVLCFQKYLEHSGTRISRAEMEMNLHGKLADSAFLSDIKPLIASGVDWDPGEAAGFVLREFVSRLPGSPWKGAT